LEVLESLEKELNIKFNFNHDNLPKGTYSFSCSGDTENILKVACSVLNRNFSKLDEHVYVVQQDPISSKNKIAPQTIQGWIKDEYGQTVVGATVWIPNLNKANQSNLDGQFQLKGYFDKNEKLQVRYLGYETITLPIVRFLDLKNKTIVLKTKSHILGNIEVTEYISWRDQTTEKIDVLDTEKMMPLAGRNDNDALSVIQLLPGISSATEDVSKIQIRGGAPDQTGYKWNGIQIFQTSHFYGKVSAVNPFMVDQITVNRNGGSAEESGQASGTIALSNHSKADSLNIEAYADLLYTNLATQIPLFDKKLQLDFGWRRSYFDLYQSFVYDRFFDQSFQFGSIPNTQYYVDVLDLEEFITLIPKYNFQDITFSLQYQASPKDHFRFNALSFESSLAYFQEGEFVDISPIDSLKLENTGYSASYQRRWTKNISSQISWTKSTFLNRYRFEEYSDSSTINREQTQLNEVAQENFKFKQTFDFKKFEINLGYQLERYRFRSFNEDIDFFGSYNHYNDADTAYEQSVFIQPLIKLSPRWNLEPGIRWSKYSQSPRHLFEPRIHLSIIPTDHLTLHGHYGWYHQNLNQVSLFTALSVEDRYWYLASEENEWWNETPIAQNKQWSLGARYRKNRWSVSLDYYRKAITNINTQAFDFTFSEDPYKLAEMDIQGIETVFQYDSPLLSMLWTYEYTRDEFYIIEDDIRYKSPYTQPHRISLFQGTKWKQFEFSLLWRFAVGRPYSAPTELATYQDPDGNMRYRLDYGPLLTEKESNYHTLDASILYNIGKRKKSKVKGKFGLSFTNLYNRKNVIQNFYYIDYKVEPFESKRLDKRGLPFTPNLSLQLSFGK